MTQTIVGAVSDRLGHAASWATVHASHPGRTFDARRTFWACPADRFRPVQPADIPLQAGHDGGRIGTVVHLALRSKLWLVAEIDDPYDLSRRPWQLSYDLTENRDGLFTLRAVAVVEKSATICMPKIEVRDGNLNLAVGRLVRQDGIVETLVREAHEHSRRRKSGEPLIIEGAGPTVEHTAAATYEPDWRPVGALELRSATAVDVNRARRELDLIIAPAETPTVIYEHGKRYTETFSRGAFAGTDPSRVRVNRDHVREKVIGRALSLDAWDERGLTGTVRLSRTALADEALALIADDLLEVSAGFAVATNGDEWRGSHRRVRRAELAHVALVVQAAYAGAKVTAVRGQSRTPNLDRLLASR